MENPYAAPSSELPKRGFSGNSGEISERVIGMLRGTQPWARIVSICGFISSAINLFNLVRYGSLLPPITVAMQVAGLIVGMYLAVKLMAYASRIGDLLQSRSSFDLESALSEHRRYWKLLGILVLVVMIFAVIAFLLALGSGSGSRYR